MTTTHISCTLSVTLNDSHLEKCINELKKLKFNWAPSSSLENSHLACYMWRQEHKFIMAHIPSSTFWQQKFNWLNITIFQRPSGVKLVQNLLLAELQLMNVTSHSKLIYKLNSNAVAVLTFSGWRSCDSPMHMHQQTSNCCCSPMEFFF